MARSVPIIDLTPFRTGRDKASVARQVREACQSIGFLVVSGHGVPDATMEAMVDASTRFFALPAEVKKTVKSTVPGTHRGYSELANMSLGQSLGVDAAPDLREGFVVTRVDKQDPYFADPKLSATFADNVWPDDGLVPGFREAYTAYYRAMEALAADIMRVFALALDLPEPFFDDKIARHFSRMSAFHYPPMPEAPKPGQLRGGAHTDFGSLTLVYGAPSIRGLQVWNGTDWEDVPEMPGTFVVNLGDLMQRWTNDLWRSTLHRVANPPDSEWDKARLSLVFFHQPNFDLVIESLDRDNPPKHAPITSGEHLSGKLAAMRTAA